MSECQYCDSAVHIARQIKEIDSLKRELAGAHEKLAVAETLNKQCGQWDEKNACHEAEIAKAELAEAKEKQKWAFERAIKFEKAHLEIADNLEAEEANRKMLSDGLKKACNRAEAAEKRASEAEQALLDCGLDYGDIAKGIKKLHADNIQWQDKTLRAESLAARYRDRIKNLETNLDWFGDHQSTCMIRTKESCECGYINCFHDPNFNIQKIQRSALSDGKQEKPFCNQHMCDADKCLVNHPTDREEKMAMAYGSTSSIFYKDETAQDG